MLSSSKRNGVASRGSTKAPPPSQASANQVREEAPAAPPAEVVERAQRRQFTAEYKARILREVEEALASGEQGAVGALLRREGLFSSLISSWRAARDRGELAGLAPKKRGRKASKNPLTTENQRLQRQNTHLENELEKARIVISVQKKLSLLLGKPIPDDPEENR
jgi:transposase-like protein